MCFGYNCCTLEYYGRAEKYKDPPVQRDEQGLSAYDINERRVKIGEMRKAGWRIEVKIMTYNVMSKL